MYDTSATRPLSLPTNVRFSLKQHSSHPPTVPSKVSAPSWPSRRDATTRTTDNSVRAPTHEDRLQREGGETSQGKGTKRGQAIVNANDWPKVQAQNMGNQTFIQTICQPSVNSNNLPKARISQMYTKYVPQRREKVITGAGAPCRNIENTPVARLKLSR